MCLLIHITFLCRPSASNRVTSLEAPVEAWGAFENFTPLIKCMPDPVEKKKGEEGKELRKCLCLVFDLFLAQKAIKVNGSLSCA